MDEITVTRAEERETSEADPTTGMVREQAFADDQVWAGVVTTEPQRPSGWHHHGDYESYLYVTSGKVELEFGPDGNRKVEAGPGDFVHVPKQLVHREVNPSDEPGAVVLIRVGSGPPVVNLDGPARDQG